MANIVDQLKKFFSRITTVNNPNEIPGSSIADVIAYATKNLNVNANGNLIGKLTEIITPEAPATPALTAFAVGDTIEKGTTYAFDKSKGSDIEAMLNGLSYEIDPEFGLGIIELLGTFTLTNGDREPTLIAVTDGNVKGLFVTDRDKYVSIYATGDMNYGGGFISAVQGWNIEGDTYTVNDMPTSSIQSILETTPAWNGVLVGKAESEASAPNLTPFTVGDVLESGDKIVFDTSKDAELLSALQNIEYDTNGSFSFNPIVYGYRVSPDDTIGDMSLLMAVKLDVDGETHYLLMTDPDNPNGDDFNPIVWASGNGTFMELPYVKGFQNLDADNYVELVFEGFNFETDLVCAGDWNGTIVGKGV